MNNLKIFVLPALFILVVVTSEWLATDEISRVIVHSGQLVVSMALVWIGYRKEIIPFARKLLGR